MEGSSSKEKRKDQKSSQDHVVRASKKMWLYRENETLCDVILIAGEDKQRISAHRVVLSAASDYFEAMFTGDFRESREEEVILNEIPGDDLRRLVKFCYTGELELSEESSVESVKTLMSSANLLQLKSVVRDCGAFLKRYLHSSNCLGIAVFADQHSCDALLEAARKYANQHFLEVCKKQEFLQISAVQLGKLLASDDLNVPSEEDVFRALLAWFQHASKERKVYIPDLLVLIRLHHLSPEFIVDQVKPLCESRNCLDLVTKAFEWKLIPERRDLMPNQKSRRSGKGKLLAVIRDNSRSRYVLRSYCPETKQWTLETEFMIGRNNCSTVLANNNIIFIGGYEGGASKKVDSFDIKTKTLKSLSPMNYYRRFCCAAVLDGFLYVFGGEDSKNKSLNNTVERLDLSSGIWNMETPMQTKRSEAGVAAFEGRLFVIGGLAEKNQCLNSVERYDPQTKEWSFRASMEKRRSFLGVTATRDYIYAFGGYDHENRALSCVERYDPRANLWTIVASLNISDWIRSVLVGEKILCATMPSGKVVQFDPENNTSSEFPKLDIPSGHSFNNLFYNTDN
ncbi:kelch-like protein 5 [Phlebotomus argentipes]|uniref:kelch-like protein 5 n=1 Tax=Phlebotomus argentipes TaxID=94469 RepID=UPI0028933FB2|nr:kelch-like protein 5 [Phlebotomus argentipes]